MKNCDNCHFWDQSRENEFTGFCRRYAPSRPTPSAREVSGVHLSELWPVTGRGAWCGEFQPREKTPPGRGERIGSPVESGALAPPHDPDPRQ